MSEARLAIVGGGVTKDRAPFDDLSVVIWSTASVGLGLKRCDVIFELHDGLFPPEELNAKGVPIYMRESHDDIPNSRRFPINELIKQAHDNAVKRGFYICRYCQGEGCNQCYHSGQSAKYNVYRDIEKENDEFIDSTPESVNIFNKDSEQSEIADMILILLAYCGEMNYDVEKLVTEKMEYNKIR